MLRRALLVLVTVVCGTLIVSLLIPRSHKFSPTNLERTLQWSQTATWRKDVSGCPVGTRVEWALPVVWESNTFVWLEVAPSPYLTIVRPDMGNLRFPLSELPSAPAKGDYVIVRGTVSRCYFSARVIIELADCKVHLPSPDLPTQNP